MRTSIRVVALVSIGAVLNVLVAWVCLLQPMPRILPAGPSGWPTPVPASWPEPETVHTMHGLGVSSVFADADGERHAGLHSCGLPFRSLWSVYYTGPDAPPRSPGWFSVWGVKMPKTWLGWIGVDHSVWLPQRAHWPGFAANTVLYAAALAALTYGLPAVRGTGRGGAPPDRREDPGA